MYCFAGSSIDLYTIAGSGSKTSISIWSFVKHS
jgi:hypothetical protein